MSGCAANSAFSARSQRFRNDVPLVATAPDPGAYNYFQTNTMAYDASTRGTSAGAFGGRSARDMPWQREAHGSSADDAPLRSSFGSARGAPPSAAFAGASGRFASPKEGTPGPGAYAPTGRTPLSPSNRLNRSSSFGGRAKRFGIFKDDETPAPGQFDPKPGAFDAVSKRNVARSPSPGFGARAARGSPFGGKDATDAGPGAYDSHRSNGAFPAASNAATPRGGGGGSAAFASRSSRFDRPGSAKADEGPDPTAYNAHKHGTIGGGAKTFNRTAAKGGGGFGVSTRRPDGMGTNEAESTPGPGAYADSRSASPRRHASPAASRPSAAFASKGAAHDSYHRKTVAPSVTEYDAHRATGIAASATRSFNKHAGTKAFGPRAVRPLEKTATLDGDTPAPGEYTSVDPMRPVITATAHKQARSPAANHAFLSTERRDTGAWTGVDREN